MIFNRLALDILEDDYFKRLFKKLNYDYSSFVIYRKNGTSLKKKSLSDLYRYADILSNSDNEEHRNLALKIMSNLQVFYGADEEFNFYLNAVLTKLGNFPAMNILDNKFDLFLPLEREIELIYKKYRQEIVTEENQFYTDVQYRIITKMRDKKNFSFSGPTSIGKSYIIKDLIKYNLQTKSEIKCFIIVVPTKALINQIIVEFNEYLRKNELKYNVNIFSHFDEDLEMTEKNIYVLTPERLLAMINEKLSPKIDMVFIDEAHKLGAENDSRSVTLYLAIEKVIQKYPTCSIYFSSPNVANPEVLLETYNLETSSNTFKTVETPVNQSLFYLDIIDGEQLIWNPMNKKMEKYHSDNSLYSNQENLFFEIGNGYSNIIYSHSIDQNINNATNFTKYLALNTTLEIEVDEEIDQLIELIRDTLHAHCFLIDCLKYGVAYHFSGLPQSIRLTIEELFKRNKIKYLFCTATLLEGVNLPAKNVFILQNKKGRSKMSVMDFWNLAGRAGRLSFELAGNVICVRSNKKHWSSNLLLENKNTVIQPIVTQKTTKNIKKIKNILTNGNRKNDSTENKILNYISNIVSIDGKNEGNSVLINKMKEKDPEVFKIINERYANLNLPYDILKKSYLIGIEEQEAAYKNIVDSLDFVNSLFEEVTYDNCLLILNIFYEVYGWSKYEKELSKKERLKYYAFLMNQWMNGITLKKIIKGSIDYKVDKNQRVYVFNQPTDEYFSASNPAHINMVIREVLSDIENVIQYNIQVYLENFLNILEYLNKTEQNSWLKFIEYGTNNKVEIALQNLGLSRAAAKYLVSMYGHLIINESNEVLTINIDKLEKVIDQSNPYSQEILKILN